MDNKRAVPQKYKLLINVAKILGSAFLLIWATFGLDWVKFGRVLTEINLWYLLLTPVVYAMNNTFSALRWQVILKQWDIEPGTWRLWKIYLISSFWGNFLPSTIGGDGYRFLALRSLPNAGKTKIFSSLLLDRLYGYVALVIVHFMVVIFYWRGLQNSTFLVNVELAIFAAAILLGIVWLAAGRFLNSRNTETSSSGWLTRIVNKISEIFLLFKGQDWRISAWGLFYSALFVSTVAIAWQIYYLAAGVQVDWGIAFYAATLIGILGILPITLNGIGIMELCQVTILNWQGLPVEKAILAAFLTRIMLVILTLPGGLLYMLNGFKVSSD
ncbi:MAG: flippase-like domain-containing protein [Chloroflexi bacterium]|nr:flippase-like domain-containing protein [Chloroflexota bacterium]